jgi:hypothetical protein
LDCNSFGGFHPATSTGSGYNLPKRNATVVRGHALMPIWPEACLGETQNGSFKKIPVLETSASEDYPQLRIPSRDLNDHFS